MGNFSYIAQNDNEPLRNPWHGNDLCELQLVIGGQVVERMRGVYSGYGSVEHEQPFRHSVKLASGEWLDVTEYTKQRMEIALRSGDIWFSHTWSNIVNIHFDESGNDGIAAWHLSLMDSFVPNATHRSENDPNQGDIFYDGEIPEDDYDDE